MQHDPALKFVVPAANNERYAQLQSMLGQCDPQAAKAIKLIEGNSHQAMAAAESVLMASGTTTLEAMLLKKPMVVAYRMAPLSYQIISRMVKAPYICLPNLLADKALVPEFLQEQVTPSTLAKALMASLNDAGGRQMLETEYMGLHKALRLNASERAATVLLDLINERHVRPVGRE